jgi:hypothetical protein
MKKIIRVTESELVKLIGKVINEQTNVPMLDPTKIPGATFKTPASAMNPQGGLNQFTQQKPLNIGCIGLKSPETNKTITGINGDVIKFFSNGRFADVKGQKGNYVCGNQANIINLMYDSDPKAVKYFNMSPQPVKPKVPAKPKVLAKPNPQVMELQKQLKDAGYDLGTSGPNKDGVDGVMGPKTKAAEQLMIQQKGQQALQGLAKKGRDIVNPNRFK